MTRLPCSRDMCSDQDTCSEKRSLLLPGVCNLSNLKEYITTGAMLHCDTLSSEDRPTTTRDLPRMRPLTTSPQRGSKSSFSIVLISTTRRRIPTSASTHEGPDKSDLIGVSGTGRGAAGAGHVPAGHGGTYTLIPIPYTLHPTSQTPQPKP